MKRLGAIAVLGLALAPADAAPVVEPRTGLSVDPPQGYRASLGIPHSGLRPGLTVSSLSGPPSICFIGFDQRAMQGASLEELNRQAAMPESLAKLRQTLGREDRVLELKTIEVSGVVGSVAVVESNAGGGSKDKSLVAIFDTPKGRTEAACGAAGKAFPARKKGFEAIIRSIVAPR